MSPHPFPPRLREDPNIGAWLRAAAEEGPPPAPGHRPAPRPKAFRGAARWMGPVALLSGAKAFAWTKAGAWVVALGTAGAAGWLAQRTPAPEPRPTPPAPTTDARLESTPTAAATAAERPAPPRPPRAVPTEPPRRPGAVPPPAPRRKTEGARITASKRAALRPGPRTTAGPPPAPPVATPRRPPPKPQAPSRPASVARPRERPLRAQLRHFRRAEAAIAARAWAAAETALSAATASAPDGPLGPDIRLAWVDWAVQQGRWRRARPLLRAAIADPALAHHRPQLYALLGDAHRAEDDPEAAAEAYRTALGLGLTGPRAAALRHTLKALPAHR